MLASWAITNAESHARLSFTIRRLIYALPEY